MTSPSYTKAVKKLRKAIAERCADEEIEHDAKPYSKEELAAFEAKHKVELPACFRELMLSVGPIGEPLLNYSQLDLPDDEAVARMKAKCLLSADNTTEAKGQRRFDPTKHDVAYRDGTLLLGVREDDEVEAFLICNGPFEGQVWCDLYGYFGEFDVRSAGDFFEVLAEALEPREGAALA